MLVRRTPVVLEGVGGQTHLLAGVAERLARAAALKQGQVIKILADKTGDLKKNPAALTRGHFSPGARGRFDSCVHGRIDIGRASLGNLG